MRRSIYFNYAGVAPIPFDLFLKLLNFLFYYYYVGPPRVMIKYDKYIPLLYQEIANLLNCSPKEISYIKNTTEGVILAAESLPLKEGDEILVMQCEYSANFIPWLKLKKQGIDVKLIGGESTEISYLNLIRSISPRTKAIAVSWVQFYDGYTSDIKSLSLLCKQKNIFLIVDAVQIAGTRTIDLSAVNIDILMCGSHKHLMSIVGCGFIYVNQNTLPLLKEHKVGTRSVKFFNKNEYEIRNDSSRFEDGTPNLLGIFALYTRIRSINKIGVKAIEQKSLELLDYYKSYLTENDILFIDHAQQGNLISLPVKNPLILKNELEKAGIYVRVINDVIRISFSYLNKRSDIKKFVKVFKSNVEVPETIPTSKAYA